jgi:hypothetical protein
MDYKMSRAGAILFVLVASAVSFAVAADTNAVTVAKKCQPAASASVVAVAGETAFDRAVKAEMKDAAADAKAEYKDRYEELKTAHDKFMDRVSILVTILAIAAGFMGIGTPILERNFRKKMDKAQKRIDELEKFETQFTKDRARDSLAMMKFVWVEFLVKMKGGNVGGREIAHPLYRSAEVLWQAYEIGDAHFLTESVNTIARVIKVYWRIAPSGSAMDIIFKTFVKKNRIFIDSLNFYNLENKMGKTSSLDTVLKFMNEFGITMFGEVRG